MVKQTRGARKGNQGSLETSSEVKRRERTRREEAKGGRDREREGEFWADWDCFALLWVALGGFGLLWDCVYSMTKSWPKHKG